MGTQTKSRAVATRGKTETAPQSPAERQLDALRDKIAKALPAHIPAERFCRVAQFALSRPQIVEIAASEKGQESIVDALLKAATDGLLLDGREAALVPYRTEKHGALVQYQSMVAGIMKRARNSGEIADVLSQVVYADDEFILDFVPAAGTPPIVHRPALGQSRGELLGAYALVRLRDGTYTQPEWMSRDQINQIMQRTRSRDRSGNIAGPWKTDYPEMARKTVIRRAAKSWPTSTDRDGRDLMDVVSAGDELFELAPDGAGAALPVPGRKRMQARALLTDASKRPDETPPPQAGAADQQQRPTDPREGGGDGGDEDAGDESDM